MIIVVGRGHSGTRVASRLLCRNGVSTGRLNRSGDMIPGQAMYEAVEIYLERVDYVGNYQWDFSRANASTVPESFEQKVYEYLDPIQGVPEPKFFKIPESNLCYPWLVRMFPEADFIYWVRDPRDARPHNSDTVRPWLVRSGFDRSLIDTPLLVAASWKFQYDLVNSVPRPKSFMSIRYEDFCLEQGREVSRLSAFLRMDLERLPNVHTNGVYKWKQRPAHQTFHFLEPAIRELGYEEVQEPRSPQA